MKVTSSGYQFEWNEGVEDWSGEVTVLDDEAKEGLFSMTKNKMIENKPYWISVTKLSKGGVAAILNELNVGPYRCQ